MVKMYWALDPEEVKEFIAKTKSLMTKPPSDFESYLIDDILTWHIEAGNTVDPGEVRSGVRRYIRSRQSAKIEEAPPPVQAGGGQNSDAPGDDSGSIFDDVFSNQ
jgi:hypothetical protein